MLAPVYCLRCGTSRTFHVLEGEALTRRVQARLNGELPATEPMWCFQCGHDQFTSRQDDAPMTQPGLAWTEDDLGKLRQLKISAGE